MKFDIQCIIPSSKTAGQLAAYKERTLAHTGPPLHRHRNQTEIFHVIEGRYLFQCEGEQQELGPGDTIAVPPGAAHAFKNVGDDTATLHFELLPAGRSEAFFDRIVNDMESVDDIGKLFDEFEMDLLGPPL